MTHTVEKIGGTSIANSDVVFDNVLINGRSGDALYNRIFVVSAYAGMTDRLLEHKKSGKPGVYGLFAGAQSKWAWSDAITEIGDAMTAKNREVFGQHADCETADAFVRERIEGVRNCLIDLHRLCSYGQFRLDEHLVTVREMLSALGEAHSAHNTALLLRQKGVNAQFVDLTGWRDERELTLQQRIREGLEKIDLEKELPIVTGYAAASEGMVKTYDRGYTEVTFSHVAIASGASEAVIHKEFHLSSADPKLVGQDKVIKIGRTNYDVADQLSNMGMEAVHPRAAKGLRQAGIPLRVKNTFDPEDAGTVIDGDYVSGTPRAEIVTGIRNIVALELFEQDMVGVKGYDEETLRCLTRHGVRIVTKCSNANTIIHYVEGTRKAVKRVVSDLEACFGNATVRLSEVAIVSVIGSDLALPGLTARAATALNAAGVEIRGIHQLMRDIDLQIIIDESRFEVAIRALHACLVEDREPTEAGRSVGAALKNAA